MTNRKRHLVPVLLAAALALGVGLGPAQAEPGLGKAQVRKIAAQVLGQRAGTLTVAKAAAADAAGQATQALRADRAGDADLLAGQPPTAYRTPAVQFTLPSEAPAGGNRAYTFQGLAAGTYLVTYNAFLVAGPQSDSTCVLRPSPSSSLQEGWSYGARYSNYLSNNGSTLLTIGAQPPQLSCGASGTWSIGSASVFGGSRVNFVRVDGVTVGTATTDLRDGTGSAAPGPAVP